MLLGLLPVQLAEAQIHGQSEKGSAWLHWLLGGAAAKVLCLCVGFCMSNVVKREVEHIKNGGSLLDYWTVSKNYGSIALAIGLLGIAKPQKSIANCIFKSIALLGPT